MLNVILDKAATLGISICIKNKDDKGREFIATKWLKFMPGRNTLTGDRLKLYELMKKTKLPALMNRLDDEILKELSGNIEDLSAAELVKLVENTFDLNELESLKKKARQQQVKRALEKQISKVREAEKALKGDKEATGG